MLNLRTWRITTRIGALVVGLGVLIICLAVWLGLLLQRSLLEEKMAGVDTALNTACECLNKIRESEIADEWAKGLFEKDTAKVQAAREDIAKWNADNAESPIHIKFSQVLSRVKQMNMTKEQRIAKTAPAEIRATVRNELAASR